MSGSSGPQHEILPVFRWENAVPDRLVSLIPDELARKVPEHPLFAFPKTDRLQDGLIEVSAKSFANAINRTSWYLESLLGKAPQGFPCIGYLGRSEIKPCSNALFLETKSVKMTSDTSFLCLVPSKLGTRLVKCQASKAFSLHDFRCFSCLPK